MSEKKKKIDIVFVKYNKNFEYYFVLLDVDKGKLVLKNYSVFLFKMV